MRTPVQAERSGEKRKKSPTTSLQKKSRTEEPEETGVENEAEKGEPSKNTHSKLDDTQINQDDDTDLIREDEIQETK